MDISFYFQVNKTLKINAKTKTSIFFIDKKD